MTLRFNRIEWMMLILAWLAVGCTAIAQHREPPQDWPELKIVEHKVGFWELQTICETSGVIFLLKQSFGCAWIDFKSGVCNVYYAADDTDSQNAVREHEFMHCKGYDHIGQRTLADAWEKHKRGAHR